MNCCATRLISFSALASPGPARQAVFRPCNGFVSQQAFIQCAQTLAKRWVAQGIPEQGREFFRSAVMMRQGKLETASPELPEVRRMPT
jgi:hypothetical protein